MGNSADMVFVILALVYAGEYNWYYYYTHTHTHTH